MNKEQEKSYFHKVEVAHLDAHGYIKPHGYQHIISKVIDEHLIAFNMDFNACMEKNFSWVLVALNVEIKKHVQGCAKLELKTWFSERKRTYFRREIQAIDEEKNIVFVASLYSILLDLTTHSIYRKSELPFDLMHATPEFLLESSPVFKENIDYKENSERIVHRSFIDALGHVNNCRYGEFAFDALPASFADLSKTKAFDLYFCSELKLNEHFSITEHIEENNIQNIEEQEKRIVLHGYNNTRNKTSFYAVFKQ